MPRNRVTGGESPLNPPAAGFSPRVGRFAPAPSVADVVSPPALPGAWAHDHDVVFSRARVVSRPWAVLGRRTRARARTYTRLGRNSPPGPPDPKNLFLFLFHHFPFSYLYLDILCTKNYPNTF